MDLTLSPRRTPKRCLNGLRKREKSASRSSMPTARSGLLRQEDISDTEYESLADQYTTPKFRQAQLRRRQKLNRIKILPVRKLKLSSSPVSMTKEITRKRLYSDRDFVAPPKNGSVWKWFKCFKEKESALCIECHAEIPCVKGSTLDMNHHLEVHNSARALDTNLQMLADQSTFNISRSMKDRIVTSLATVSNIPMKLFSNSDFQMLFQLSKLGAISGKIALKCIDRSFSKIQRSLSDELQLLLEQGAIFTLTADEWPCGGKMYMGITLHSSNLISSVDKYHLDLLTQFRDKRNIEGIKDALIESLKKVGLRMTDIRGITTDDTAIMRRLGRELMEEVAPRVFYHQFCFAHAVHIAVLEALGFDPSEKKTLSLHWPISEDEVFEEAADLGSDSEDDNDDFDQSLHIEQASEESALPPIIDYRYSVVLNKVRKCIHEIITNPTRKEKLEYFIFAMELERECNIFLDVPSRWKSTLKMIDHFLVLEFPIRILYLKDCQEFPLSDSDLDLIKSMMGPLKQAELATERLCNECKTLFDADLVLQKLLSSSMSFKTSFGNTLTRNLSARLFARRKNASILLRSIYAANSDVRDLDYMIKAYGPDFGQPPDRCQRISSHSEMIANELKKYISEPNELASENDLEYFEAAFADKLFTRATEMIWKMGGKEINLSEKVIKQEGTGPRLSNSSLVFAIKVLKTIQPTSVPAERSFGEARLTQYYCKEPMDSDAFLRKVFLKGYYLKQKEANGSSVVDSKSNFSGPANLDDYSTTES